MKQRDALCSARHDSFYVLACTFGGVREVGAKQDLSPQIPARGNAADPAVLFRELQPDDENRHGCLVKDPPGRATNQHFSGERGPVGANNDQRGLTLASNAVDLDHSRPETQHRLRLKA